jgi:MFS family permease
MGILSDRVGRCPILNGSLIATIIASIGFVVAKDVAGVLIARFLEGLAVGGVSGTALAVLNDLNYSAAIDLSIWKSASTRPHQARPMESNL